MGRGGEGCREPSSKMDCIGRVVDCIFVRPLRAPSCPSGVGDLCALFDFFLFSRMDGCGDFRRLAIPSRRLGEFSARDNWR